MDPFSRMEFLMHISDDTFRRCRLRFGSVFHLCCHIFVSCVDLNTKETEEKRIYSQSSLINIFFSNRSSLYSLFIRKSFEITYQSFIADISYEIMSLIWTSSNCLKQIEREKSSQFQNLKFSNV